MDGLKKRWAKFVNIVVDPWALLLAVFTIALVVWSAFTKDQLLGALLNILITLTASVFGGAVTKQWIEVNEERVLVTRARTAVRGLKLLLGNLISLEKRTASFLADPKGPSVNADVVKRNYEEIVSNCTSLQEETVSSIENWTDILPEADIKTQIGAISALRQELDTKKYELVSMNENLKQLKGQSEQERNKLQTDIHAKEIKIRELSNEIVKQQLRMGPGLYGLPPTDPTSKGVTLSDLLKKVTQTLVTPSAGPKPEESQNKPQDKK